MGTFAVELNVFCIMICIQACRDQGVECGALKENGTHKFIESKHGLIKTDSPPNNRIVTKTIGPPLTPPVLPHIPAFRNALKQQKVLAKCS